MQKSEYAGLDMIQRKRWTMVGIGLGPQKWLVSVRKVIITQRPDWA